MMTARPSSLSIDRGVTAQDVDCLKDAFDLFDHNKDGKISVDELDKVMSTHGFRLTEQELTGMISRVDANANGAVDFHEFIDLMVRKDSCMAEEENDEEHTFRVFDHNGDGLISKGELLLTMNRLGETLTEEEVENMIMEADLDGDGKINKQEFSRLMYNVFGANK